MEVGWSSVRFVLVFSTFELICMYTYKCSRTYPPHYYPWVMTLGCVFSSLCYLRWMGRRFFHMKWEGGFVIARGCCVKTKQIVLRGNIPAHFCHLLGSIQTYHRKLWRLGSGLSGAWKRIRFVGSWYECKQIYKMSELPRPPSLSLLSAFSL